MDFEFSEEQELLRASVTRYLAEQLPIPVVRELLDDPAGMTPACWAGLADLGAVGLLVPEAAGGAGRGMLDVAVVLESMGRAVTPGPFIASAVGASSILTLADPTATTTGLLARLAAGTAIATTALSLDPSLTARRVGGEWRLEGVVTDVADAAGADHVVVSAAAGGEAGLFVVEREASGVTVSPTPSVDATRRFARLALTQVVAQRIEAGDPHLAVSAALDRLGVALVVDGVGAASRVLELAVEYAKERVQFDRPIGSFQAVQHLCADMLRRVELARAAAYYACWACDAADARERHRAATMARAFAADELYQVGADAIQVFAGIGFTWEHDAHLYYKRLLTLQTDGGGSAAQLEELAALVLD